MSETFNFGLIFIKRFYKIIKQISNKETTLVLLFYLLLVAIIYEVASYNVGMISGAFYKILGEKDLHQFFIQLIKALVLIISIAFLISCKEYVASCVYLEWRKNLTKNIHLKYFSNLSFYKLNVIEKDKDNLDQRITQDVDTFSKYLSLVLTDLLVSPFIIAYYAYISFQTTGYIGPLGCFIFFLISTVFNKSLISSVLNSVYLQQKSEGDFRYQHLHVRNNAESIALQSGHNFEYKKSETLFDKLIAVQDSLILRQFELKISVNLFDYLGSIVSFILLSFPLFSGKYDNYSATDLSQLISQNAFVSIYLINCFTRLIDTSTNFATIGGTTHRIAEVLEKLEQFEDKQDIPKRSDSNSSFNYLRSDYFRDISDSKIFFKFTNVSINVPKSDRNLINKLNLEMNKDSNVLISGSSGTAKTSILRVLKGIWTETSGTVERYLPFDNPKVVLFLPQKPIMTTGSLIEQITYPLRPESQFNYSSNEEIKEQITQITQLMTFLGLNQILERIGNDVERPVDWNWNDCLSPGEQQRLSFVRLFYHRPFLAILDESTSAVSLQMERKIYEECAKLKIVLISCGHRSSLEEYHQKVLRVIKCNLIDSNKLVNESN